MRLSVFECETLKNAARDSFGERVELRLFGSRADDSRKGGDIDLLINVALTDPTEIARAHTRFLSRVYAQMGEQKLDVLIDFPGRQSKAPIFELARQEGVRL